MSVRSQILAYHDTSPRTEKTEEERAATGAVQLGWLREQDSGSTCLWGEQSIYLTPLTSGGFLVYVVSPQLPVARPILPASRATPFSSTFIDLRRALSLPCVFFLTRMTWICASPTPSFFQLKHGDQSNKLMSRSSEPTSHPYPHNTNMAALKTAFLFLFWPILGHSNNKYTHQLAWLITLILLSSMSPILLNLNLAGKNKISLFAGFWEPCSDSTSSKTSVGYFYNSEAIQ